MRGRKRGLCAVLGFQAITQLRAIYGHDQTATLAAAPATKLILRTGEAETARWSSAQIGEREVTRAANRRQHRAERLARQLQHPPASSWRERRARVARFSCCRRSRAISASLAIIAREVTIPYLAPVRRQPGFVPESRLAHDGLSRICDRQIVAARCRSRAIVPPGRSFTRKTRLRRTALASLNYAGNVKRRVERRARPRPTTRKSTRRTTTTPKNERVVGQWFGEGATSARARGRSRVGRFSRRAPRSAAGNRRGSHSQRQRPQRAARRMGRDLQRAQVRQHPGVGWRRRATCRGASRRRQLARLPSLSATHSRASAAAANGL